MKTNEHFSPKANQDIKLVNKALEGDQKAYAELFDRYRDSIYFMMLKMVKNKNDADDLTIEAFGKAFKKLEQYTSDYAFSTWLFKIASNNGIDFLRKKKAITISIDEGYDNNNNDYKYDIECENPNPEETFITSQNFSQLYEFVQKMKPRYKELIELRYFKEFAYEEIAQHMNLPLGTVKAQLFRARELLNNVSKRLH